jgi:hypothetical protein
VIGWNSQGHPAAYRDIFGAHDPAMALVQVVRLVKKPRGSIEATAVVPR